MTRSCVEVGDAKRSVHVAVFQQSRMRGAVWVDEAVHAEVSVVDFLAVIATVEVHILAGVLILACVYSMVAPLPDESTAHRGVLIDNLKIVFKVSGAVTH